MTNNPTRFSIECFLRPRADGTLPLDIRTTSRDVIVDMYTEDLIGLFSVHILADDCPLLVQRMLSEFRRLGVDQRGGAE